MKWSVGQTVCVVRPTWYGKREPITSAVVKSVVRKWVTLVGYERWRVDMETGAIDGRGLSPGYVYSSRDEYESAAALASAWSSFRVDVDRCHTTPDTTLEKIAEARVLLGIPAKEKEGANVSR